MPIQRIPVSDRAAWLKLREADITASVAGALFGVHDYITAAGLWLLKAGRIEEDPEETAPMRRGRLLEPAAVQMLREERPTWILRHNAGAEQVYLRDPAARLGATIDVFAEDPERGPGVVQLKSVEPSIFRKKWRDPETQDISPPLWIAVQALVEAELAGAKWAAVAALTISHGARLEIVDIPLKPHLMGTLRGLVADFWRSINEDRQPEFDFARDAALISDLYAEDDGSEVDLRDNNRLPELLNQKEGLSEAVRQGQAKLKEINAELLAAVGSATRALVANGVITARTVQRKGFSVEPTSYRTTRFKRDVETMREAAE